jgi:Helitron helicase-like domain at N-terminus
VSNVPNSRYVRDYEDENFALAFLKQYPYGTGGPNEIRECNSGKQGIHERKLYIDEYVSHVTNLSDPRFSEALFTLVCFNLFFRQKMVQSAGWKVRADNKAANRIACLAPEPVIREIERRNTGGNVVADDKAVKDFLRMIRCVTKNLPHTSKAAKDARKDVLSLQIIFGLPNIFFTVSPADDNSIIIAVYSGIVKPIVSLVGMTRTELNEACKQRSEVRFKYPSLSTLNFEVILDIVITNIIGWKNKKKDTLAYQRHTFTLSKNNRGKAFMSIFSYGWQISQLVYATWTM